MRNLLTNSPTHRSKMKKEESTFTTIMVDRIEIAFDNDNGTCYLSKDKGAVKYMSEKQAIAVANAIMNHYYGI